MEWIANARRSEHLPRSVIATVGNYDGVHLGQRAILARVVERARSLGLPAVVVTFEPHPLAVLAPDRAPARIASPAQKRELLAAAGIDFTLQIDFTEEFAETAAETFVREFLVARLAVREIYVGSRFVFGRDREGGIELLAKLGEDLGFHSEGVPEVLDGSEPVSSSRIRRCIAAGEVACASRLLGRAFDITGTIVGGEERGADLGFPTINLAVENELLPGNGVYTSRVRFDHDASSWAAVSNVGVRPTFASEDGGRVVESHILDFSQDVYGEKVTLSFLTRLRPERAFPSAQALSGQIRQDVSEARHYFSNIKTDPGVPRQGD